MTAKEWLDHMVVAYNAIRSLSYDDMEYRALSLRKEIQMELEVFEHVAYDARMTVTYNPNWYPKYPDIGEAYFIYRGYKFLALWDKGGNK